MNFTMMSLEELLERLSNFDQDFDKLEEHIVEHLYVDLIIEIIDRCPLRPFMDLPWTEYDFHFNLIFLQNYGIDEDES